jgi:hypothetical protein
MVIDLPRQIAALPAPGDFSASPAPTVRTRWMKAGPVARGTVISLAVAAVLGMAGMGAASLYTTLRGGHQAAPIAAPSQKLQSSATPAVTGEPTPSAMEVNAAPAHPVRGAPALGASEFAPATSLGLTADQFRDSMKAPPRPGAAAAGPALNSDAERAAASPIHRAGGNREQTTVAPQPTPAPTPVAKAGSNTAATVAAQTAVAPKLAAVATTSAQPAPAPAAPAPFAAAATPAAEPATPAHPVRRHISHPRIEQPAESDTPTKPTAATRAGSTEVQMF